MTEHRHLWTAYADGSCIGNPGPGGWGVVLIAPDGATSEYQGADPATTNNRMEITAAIEALRRTPEGARIALHSDSQYVIKTMTMGWKRRENLDLWAPLDQEVARRRVHWEWVRGHNGDPLNERADELARSAAEDRSPRERLAAAPARTAPTPLVRAPSRLDQLTPLLGPHESIRLCQHCRRQFVGSGDAQFCALLPCQVQARAKKSS